MTVKRGDLLVAFGDQPPRQRLYIEVTRVARDGTWADLKVCNWAVMWTKRQKLDERGMPPAAELRWWDMSDLDCQAAVWTLISDEVDEGQADELRHTPGAS